MCEVHLRFKQFLLEEFIDSCCMQPLLDVYPMIGGWRGYRELVILTVIGLEVDELLGWHLITETPRDEEREEFLKEWEERLNDVI